MITREEYNLKYNLYLADRDLSECDYISELKSLSEAGDMVLQEDAKEAITKFVNKIIEGIQNVWNKYKENVINTKLKYKGEDIEKCIENYPVKVTVENYVTYNIDLLNSVAVEPLTRELVMSNNLTDVETYMKYKYGNSFYTNPNVSIYDNLKNKCTSAPIGKYQVTKEDLQRMYAYMKQHKEDTRNIQKDIDSINAAAKQADALANEMPSNNNGAGGTIQPPTQAASNEAYVMEADDKPKVVDDTNDGTTTTTTSVEPNAKTPTEEQSAIQVYFKCASEILSAKMKFSRDIFFFYNSVVDKHMANCLVDKAKDKVAPQVKTTAPEAGNGGEATETAPQVNT